jgi:hypothetical protein
MGRSVPIPEVPTMTRTDRGRPSMQARGRHLATLPASLAALLITCVTLTGGCGGKSDAQQSKTEAWADRVCSTVADWRAAIDDAKTAMSDTANLSVNGIRKVVDDVSSATGTLVAGLKDAGRPQTKAGDQAQEALSLLGTRLEEQKDVIAQATKQPAHDVQGLLATVSTVAASLSTMVSDTVDTLDRLRRLDGADELEQAFKDAPGCQALRASASPSR